MAHVSRLPRTHFKCELFPKKNRRTATDGQFLLCVRGSPLRNFRRFSGLRPTFCAVWADFAHFATRIYNLEKYGTFFANHAAHWHVKVSNLIGIYSTAPVITRAVIMQWFHREKRKMEQFGTFLVESRKVLLESQILHIFNVQKLLYEASSEVLLSRSLVLYALSFTFKKKIQK